MIYQKKKEENIKYILYINDKLCNLVKRLGSKDYLPHPMHIICTHRHRQPIGIEIVKCAAIHITAAHFTVYSYELSSFVGIIPKIVPDSQCFTVGTPSYVIDQ